MELKSIYLQIPKHKPFDRGDWFEAFIGNFVIPILDRKLIHSYWFSRYSEVRNNQYVNEVRFRIKIKDYSLIESQVDDLIKHFNLASMIGEENYQGAEFLDRRFNGEKLKKGSPIKRQQLIWNFLYAASSLYVDTFSHKDQDNYWYREENHDRSNNIDGETFESIHHLMCNLSNFSPRVDLLERADQTGKMTRFLMAGHYRKWNNYPDTDVRGTQLVHF